MDVLVRDSCERFTKRRNTENDLHYSRKFGTLIQAISYFDNGHRKTEY